MRMVTRTLAVCAVVSGVTDSVAAQGRVMSLQEALARARGPHEYALRWHGAAPYQCGRPSVPGAWRSVFVICVGVWAGLGLGKFEFGQVWAWASLG